MPSVKNTYKEILQLIAEILSIEHPIEDLKYKLSTALIDWDQFVTISSNHLVMTTCYCKLLQKGLLDVIPLDLESYLKDITTINKNRNLKIIEEVKIIADIFRTHHINYSLLKGTALLVGNYYDDMGERMVGDIDILIAENQIEDAFNLLKEANYTSLITFNYDNKDFRHLPRQINPDKIAAVELHNTILNANYKNLINEKDLLLNTSDVDMIRIPNNYFLNLSTILASQINGNAYRFKQWNLKYLYDSIVLKLTLESHLPENKFVHDYMSKFYAIFSDLYKNPLDLRDTKETDNYIFRIKHYSVHRFLFKLNFSCFNLKNRIELIVSNKSYRSHVIKNKILRKR